MIDIISRIYSPIVTSISRTGEKKRANPRRLDTHDDKQHLKEPTHLPPYTGQEVNQRGNNAMCKMARRLQGHTMISWSVVAALRNTGQNKVPYMYM